MLKTLSQVRAESQASDRQLRRDLEVLRQFARSVGRVLTVPCVCEVKGEGTCLRCEVEDVLKRRSPNQSNKE